MSALLIFAALGFMALGGYMSWRGFTRNEFREPFSWGWHRYETGSFDYVSASAINLLFLLAGIFFLVFGDGPGANH